MRALGSTYSSLVLEGSDLEEMCVLYLHGGPVAPYPVHGYKPRHAISESSLASRQPEDGCTFQHSRRIPGVAVVNKSGQVGHGQGTTTWPCVVWRPLVGSSELRLPSFWTVLGLGLPYAPHPARLHATVHQAPLLQSSRSSPMGQPPSMQHWVRVPCTSDHGSDALSSLPARLLSAL